MIKSYLQWLKDSDYDSTCSLCGTNLEDEECVRLICYDLFHKKCLNSREEQLPANTAPSGHSCPSCSAIIFPPPNLVSPVADALRIWLTTVSWGRELNLPMVFKIRCNFTYKCYKSYFILVSRRERLSSETIFKSSIARERGIYKLLQRFCYREWFFLSSSRS